MAKHSLPPGFRFHPTDVELIRYYLRRKVMGKPLRFVAIAVLDIYKFLPWDLPDKSCLRSRDLQWYFFCPRDRKYAIGPRTNRATEAGYWKTTGKDRNVSYNSKIVGMKKTLVYHEGRAPKGTRTDWVMHEYRLEDQEVVDSGYSQIGFVWSSPAAMNIRLMDAYVLCRIFKKSGPGPKNGEQYGAPFKEEEWDTDDEDFVEHPLLPYASSDPGSSSSDDHHIVTSGNDRNEVHDSRAAPAVVVEKRGDELQNISVGITDSDGAATSTINEQLSLVGNKSLRDDGVGKGGNELQNILMGMADSDVAAASSINEPLSLVGNKSPQDDASVIFDNLGEINTKGVWTTNDKIYLLEENYLTLDDLSPPMEGIASADSEIDHATTATAWKEGVHNNQWLF